MRLLSNVLLNKISVINLLISEISVFMAIYNQLPVYKESYDLIIEIFKAVKEFNREYKYTLGENIKKEAIEMVTSIYRANSSFEKTSHIQKAKEKIETIRIFFRLAKDLKQVSLKKFVETNEKVENVSKQLTAWGRSQSKGSESLTVKA